ncbi:MAG: hypothetical protein IPP74_04530 [Alphaproteobacteria bacterium]|nr:hypothetical protein [Alphaproteobacteria bacterium]
MKNRHIPQNIRLLPLVIGFSAMLLVAKIVDVSLGSGFFTQEFLVSELHAKVSEDSAPTQDIKKAAPTDAAATPAASATDANLNEGGEKSPQLVSTNAVSNGASSINSPLSQQAPQEQPTIDVKLLQSLADRRKQLEDREKNLLLKETLLASTEERVDQRIKTLEQLKTQVDDLLKQYNEKEDAKIRSLVKIYENMKPKDAAKIFDQMDMPILLQVVDKMKEAKAAPILAKMSPQRAKDLTIDLALQKKLPDTIQ